ncbi:MAG: ribonuclease HII, partial [Omnitrophica WOR_2 bacterium GWC2_45_7]
RILIIGVDEAGRGPLAGPVVAAAVAVTDPYFVVEIRDSKKMTAQKREEAFHEIQRKAHVGVGIINEGVIDQINILQATFLAMNNAVRQLIYKLPTTENSPKDVFQKVCILVDGNRFQSDLPCRYKTIVGGDELIFSIACASIVAKVTRDRILGIYDQVFPHYGFKQHKGYPTPSHKQAINRFGLSTIHRKTFNFT